MSDSVQRLAILAPLKQWGGIERKMLILCKEFVARGVEVDFILTRGGTVPYPNEFPSEVTITDLGSRGKLDAVPRLIRHLRKTKPCALLTAKDHAAKVAVVARLIGRLDIRIVVKVTNTLSETLRRPVKRNLARILYPMADTIIAISCGVKDDMVSRFGMDAERIRVIYNPMVTPDLPDRARQSTGYEWFDKCDMPIILGAGRLAPQKGFVGLVEAFARLRRETPCRLVILGEGPERDAIADRARDLGVTADVFLPGYQMDPIPWMARASVFVLSSRYEGLGNVLVEAMAVGTPVVSTDCPSGPAEILEGGRYGPLVPVADAEALSAAIAGVLNDPLSVDDLVGGAARFRSGAIAEQYLAVLGLCLDGRISDV